VVVVEVNGYTIEPGTNLGGANLLVAQVPSSFTVWPAPGG